ncbi:MAG: hypothetical protein J4F49_09150 [Rhodobacteraceae bacterium]|nr:hypothetical protein [Paracoccaceae bacterium]
MEEVPSVGGLILELYRTLTGDDRVPETVREDLAKRLSELQSWPNSLCQDAWLRIDESGSGHLKHIYRNVPQPGW